MRRLQITYNEDFLKKFPTSYKVSMYWTINALYLFEASSWITLTRAHWWVWCLSSSSWRCSKDSLSRTRNTDSCRCLHTFWSFSNFLNAPLKGCSSCCLCSYFYHIFSFDSVHIFVYDPLWAASVLRRAFLWFNLPCDCMLDYLTTADFTFIM